MKAYIFANNEITPAEAPMPVLGDGQALLKVRLAGICRTDLELLRGYHGFSGIAGHEFVARVQSCSSRPELEGRRVVADINIGCGRCARCQRGQAHHCQERSAIGIKDWEGAFAQYLKAPAANLYTVPDGLTDEDAVFAEPLAAALQVSQQVHIKAGHKLLVLGDGKLGILAALGLRHYCPGLVLAGKHLEKLALAKEQGVGVRLVDEERDWGELRAAHGRFDVVVEATGRSGGLQRALEMVRPQGVICAKTTISRGVDLDLARLVVDEVTLIGSRCGDMAQALHFLERRLVRPAGLIEAVYPFDEFLGAFEHAKRPGAKKILVRAASGQE